MTRYVVYDVFTDVPFGGNQLAVIPDAAGIDPAQMQRIAAEFNFSETTFVLPAQDAAHHARIRIFTPQNELQFAGHPVIGTTVALHAEGGPADMTLELGVGPLACQARGDAASFLTPVPIAVLGAPDVQAVARCLGLPAKGIAGSPVEASLGTPFVIVRLDTVERLSACRPDASAMQDAAAQSSDSGRFSVFAYVDHGADIHARMFAPLGGIPEDPATGSACATLAALLFHQSGEVRDLTIHQGHDMGRPSLIKTTADGSGVTVSGQAVKTMEGRLVV